MKNLFKFAAMMAVVVSASSFVSCDEEDENNSFKSETFMVEFKDEFRNSSIITGTTCIEEWVWINSAGAAADSIDRYSDTIPKFDSLRIDSLIEYDSQPIISIRDVWTFKTKEAGDRELKFRRLHIYSGPIVIEADLNELRRRAKDDPSAVIKDTVIKF